MERKSQVGDKVMSYVGFSNEFTITHTPNAVLPLVIPDKETKGQVVIIRLGAHKGLPEANIAMPVIVWDSICKTVKTLIRTFPQAAPTAATVEPQPPLK